MGSVMVVAVQPVSGHVPDLLQAVEDVAVQHLGAVGPVESFHIGILGRLSWLDVVQGNALGLGPYNEERPKRSLGGLTPAAYAQRLMPTSPRI